MRWRDLQRDLPPRSSTISASGRSQLLRRCEARRGRGEAELGTSHQRSPTMRQGLGLLGLGLPLARCCQPTGFARSMLAASCCIMLHQYHLKCGFTVELSGGLNAQIGHQRDGLWLDTSVPASINIIHCTYFSVLQSISIHIIHSNSQEKTQWLHVAPWQFNLLWHCDISEAPDPTDPRVSPQCARATCGRLPAGLPDSHPNHGKHRLTPTHDP